MLTSYNVPFYCDVIFRRHTFNSFSLLQLHDYEVRNINLLGVLNVLLYFLTTKSSIHFLKSTKVIPIERAIKNHKRSCISLCLKSLVVLVHLFVTLQDKNRQDICFNFTISTNKPLAQRYWDTDNPHSGHWYQILACAPWCRLRWFCPASRQVGVVSCSVHHSKNQVW